MTRPEGGDAQKASLEVPSLIPYGWSDRVAALFTDVTDTVPDAEPGRVVRSDRGVHVIAVAGGLVSARASTDLDAPPVTGDWAAVVTDEFGDPWLAALLPRWSSLSRADPAEKQTNEQVLCANVDVLAVVVALDRQLNPNAIERMLTVAWGSGAVPLVVLTKADAVEPAELDDLVVSAESAAGGVDVVATSARTGAGVEEVRSHVTEGRTLALLGQSGAGKSTLVNALVGEDVRATGDVRAGDAKGRHTTTSRELVPLPGGGVLLDTPGIRSLSLWDAEGVAASFADVEEFAAGCRFNDCRHESEPDCAVRAAVDAGELDVRRFDNYRKLMRELEVMEQRQDEAARRRAGRAFGRQVRAHMKTNPKAGPRPR